MRLIAGKDLHLAQILFELVILSLHFLALILHLGDHLEIVLNHLNAGWGVLQLHALSFAALKTL